VRSPRPPTDRRGLSGPFAEFQGNRFTLRWRRSRYVFGIGGIVVALTPVKWESRKWDGKSRSADNRLKADWNLKSFGFTLKNPSSISIRLPKPFLRTFWNWAIEFA
jgi:hypothetical protein